MLISSPDQGGDVDRRLRLLGDRERHQQTDNTIDMADRALLAQLAISRRVQFDRNVRQLPTQNWMSAMMNSPVEHRGFEQLHGRTHADKALSVFLRRQPNAFLLASGIERFNEGAIVGNGDEIISRANLSQPADDRLEIDRLARRRLQ